MQLSDDSAPPAIQILAQKNNRHRYPRGIHIRLFHIFTEEVKIIITMSVHILHCLYKNVNKFNVYQFLS